ncbi:hypothetical protein M8542_22460 [Amycolatopsis sp. OK19-0408]|uniref:SAM-dependent methyltransferase n=1 Tax=Amycolatopsis iheyensis TaxID=2945988 RepID=A0A9X2NDA7_9PSEU|nr:hypothetical protein [Amycolatopsis iheyensis]MCR6485593.1 hypothetical protein [Amycolatopsis iheyensis]
MASASTRRTSSPWTCRTRPTTWFTTRAACTTSRRTGDANSGTELPDAQLYRDGSLHGGLAYTPDELRRLFDGYTEVELRPMRETPGRYGVPFLLAGLFRKE